jgi:hypothetical protein
MVQNDQYTISSSRDEVAERGGKRTGRHKKICLADVRGISCDRSRSSTLVTK